VDDKWSESVKQLVSATAVLDTVYVVRAVRVGVRADELIMDMRRVLEQSILLVRHLQSHQQSRRGSWFRRQPFPRAG